MKSANYFLIELLLIFAVSCATPPDWQTKVDNVVPDPVSNVKVENLNGGAIIRYTIPQQKNLLGVKVAYTLTNGENRERYASAGVDSIELEGFGDTNEYTVTLYTIHQSGNLSTGVPATIKPLTSVISTIRETLQVEPTFGGVYLRWDNPMQKDIGVSLYRTDSLTGNWVLFDNYFSNAKSGLAVFRPFKPVEQPFRIQLFDRWQNHAEPVEVKITPLEEVQIISKVGATYLWKLYDDAHYTYRGDVHNETYPLRTFEKALDGKLPHNDVNNMWNPGDDGAVLKNYIAGSTGSMPFPLYFTVDLGRKARYTRLNIQSRLRSPNFSANLPVNFEIWGTNTPKSISQVGDGSKEANLAYWTVWRATNGTDEWKNDWVRIATCRLVLSSGGSKYYVNVPLSADDLTKYTSTGYDFDINEDNINSYRYLRFVVLETNTDVNNLQLCGIRLWGLYDDN